MLAALERNSTDAARESTNLKVARVDLAVDMHLGVVKNQIQIVVNEELILGEILVILGVEARVELGDVEDAAFLNRDRLGGELVRIKGGFEGCAVFDIDILELDLAVVDGLAVVEREGAARVGDDACGEILVSAFQINSGSRVDAANRDVTSHFELAAGFNRDVVLDSGFTTLVFELAPAVGGPVELLVLVDVLLGGDGDAFNRQLAALFDDEFGAGNRLVVAILAGTGDRQSAEFSSSLLLDGELGNGVAVLLGAVGSRPKVIRAKAARELERTGLNRDVARVGFHGAGNVDIALGGDDVVGSGTSDRVCDRHGGIVLGLEGEGGLAFLGAVHVDEVTRVGIGKLAVGVGLVAGIFGVLGNRQVDRGIAGDADGAAPGVGLVARDDGVLEVDRAGLNFNGTTTHFGGVVRELHAILECGCFAVRDVDGAGLVLVRSRGVAVKDILFLDTRSVGVVNRNRALGGRFGNFFSHRRAGHAGDHRRDRSGHDRLRALGLHGGRNFIYNHQGAACLVENNLECRIHVNYSFWEEKTNAKVLLRKLRIAKSHGFVLAGGGR